VSNRGSRRFVRSIRFGAEKERTMDRRSDPAHNRVHNTRRPSEPPRGQSEYNFPRTNAEAVLLPLGVAQR